MRIVSIFSAGALALALPFGAADAKPTHVAITAIVAHPSLDAVEAGVRDALKEKGYSGENFKVTAENAQGNPAIAAQIARRLLGEAPDVIVAVSTPSAQAVAAVTKDIPIVFAAISNPRDAKLIKSYDAPGGNVTGVSDMLPIEQHLDLLLEAVPNAKSIGVPYNPGESNAVSQLNDLKEAARKKNVKIVEAAAPRSADVASAARALIGKADAVYVLLDNTVVSAFEAVVKVGIDNKIPVFSSDADSVKRGAVAAIGFNYYEHGKQAGNIAARILKGEKPGAIPVEFASTSEIFVNPAAARAFGVVLPESLLTRATLLKD